ncbi:MAG: thiaminase II [Legionellaceae bacterium]|nr:thiaminase II [Legionellaceae bacterium]
MEKIQAHPFNDELAKGILPQKKFIFYLRQDALYLADFSRALALTSARLPDNTHMQQFMQFALDAITAERDLHFSYIQAYQLKTNTIINTEAEQSPSCFMYANYLLKMANLSAVEEAVSSLLPCFYIYNEVGKKIAAKQSPNHPYHDWIALYSSVSFEQSVQSAITITNELASSCSERTREKMIDAFVRSTQLEWMFWDSAYAEEAWLIDGKPYVIE